MFSRRKYVQLIALLPGSAWVNGWAWAALLPLFILMLGSLDVIVPLSAQGQVFLSLLMWWFVLGVVPVLKREERVFLCVFIPVILLAECAFSLGLGMYRYRLENIPAFLAPGHGLIFLTALRAVRLRGKPSVYLLVAAAGAQVLYGTVQLIRASDLFGFLCSLVFAGVLFLLPKAAQRFYITLGLVVAYLEIVGTALGLWKWAPESLGLSQANPPSGAVAGYLAVDGVAFLITMSFALPAFRFYIKQRVSTQKELTPQSAPALR